MLRLQLASASLTDNDLCENLREAPPNSIILLEDVDAIFKERGSGSDGRGSGVTFSGLLNALDGVASQQGRILFMTTNHVRYLVDHVL